jgi:hypothetical protein
MTEVNSDTQVGVEQHDVTLVDSLESPESVVWAPVPNIPKLSSCVWAHVLIPKEQATQPGLLKSKDLKSCLCRVQGCGAFIKSSGRTSNVLAHFQLHHPKLYTNLVSNGMLQYEWKIHRTCRLTTVTFLTGSYPPFGRTLTQDKKKQITIKQAWDAIPNYYPTGAPEQVTTTQRILKTWCHELLPWNLMRKPSIRKMFKKLNPRYKLPSATTFLETHIPEQHVKLLGAVRFCTSCISDTNRRVSDTFPIVA